MNINNLGILNQLGNYINYYDKSDNEYAISIFLLKNFKKIDKITINKIVDEAFVSRSAIRRFCVDLGYDNFSDLKKSLNDIIFPSNIHLRKFHSIGDYIPLITYEIISAIEGINQSIDVATIESICKMINDYNQVYIVGANNTAGNLTKFQQEMFYANKIIHLVHSDYDNKKSKFLQTRDSLIITISVSGIFAGALNSIIHKTSNNYKLLITANRNPEYNDFYNQIVYISPENISDDKLGVYGKYGITYFLDLISETYINTFRTL